MIRYAAPLEGITGYVFRGAHHAVFGGADGYFTPFVSPSAAQKLSTREKNDLLPAHNRGLCIIPQVLTNQAEPMLWIMEELEEMGYETVNLNLGCPSGTVTSKGKGAGFLADPDRLDRFFETVFDGMGKLLSPSFTLSVKTRIGTEDADEWGELLRVFRRYPISQLTVHPRLRRDFYSGPLCREAFLQALEESRCPVIYNGEIRNAEELLRIEAAYPQLAGVMVGRGLIESPWIFAEAAGEEADPSKLREKLITFHTMLLEGYEETMSGDRNVLFKMKEIWNYLGKHFPDGAKQLKQIRKSSRVGDYRGAAENLLEEGTFAVHEAFENPFFMVK